MTQESRIQTLKFFSNLLDVVLLIRLFKSLDLLVLQA